MLTQHICCFRAGQYPYDYPAYPGPYPHNGLPSNFVCAQPRDPNTRLCPCCSHASGCLLSELSGGDWAQVYKNRVGLDIGDGNRDGVYEVRACRALVMCDGLVPPKSLPPSILALYRRDRMLATRATWRT